METWWADAAETTCSITQQWKTLTVLNPPGSGLVPSVLLRSWLVSVCIWASRLLSMIGPPEPTLGCCMSWVCCISCCCRSCSCCNCCCWALRLVGPCKPGIIIEPCHKKTCLRGLQPGKTQTGLLSYRGVLGSWNFAVSKYRYYSI